MRVSERAAYKASRARTIAAEVAHEKDMERICARGGKTVEQMRGMSKTRKDAFIFAYRDGGSHDQG